MTAPNIVNVTSIIGKTVYDSDVATSDATLVDTVTTDKILKINTIIAANIDGSAAATISVWVALGSGAAAFYLAKTVTVPADSSLVIISKDTSFYLEEGLRIRALASTAGDISLMCSYEEIDDA